MVENYFGAEEAVGLTTVMYGSCCSLGCRVLVFVTPTVILDYYSKSLSCKPFTSHLHYQSFLPVLSVRPKITDLNFHLYAQSVHPELFDVCARRTTQRDRYELETAITTDGHAIRFQCGSLSLTEVAFVDRSQCGVASSVADQVVAVDATDRQWESSSVTNPRLGRLSMQRAN